jgi:hypothetical protein
MRLACRQLDILDTIHSFSLPSFMFRVKLKIRLFVDRSKGNKLFQLLPR